VLVAFAATLAAPGERGKSVGIVTSGVVIGILGARFVSGVLADLGGWRLVYLTSAGMMLTMAVSLFRVLPRHAPKTGDANYFRILRSIPVLFAQDPVILLRGVFALLIFAAFSALWTSLALPLSVQPFALSHTQIGLFGLVGVCGALAASGAGTLADRGFGTWVTGASLAILLASWGLIAMLPVSIAVLVAGVALLDLAIQAVHVTNQSIIFSRHPDMKSRLVGGYMVFYSIGSAIGAIASTAVYARAGWAGVSWLGATFSMAALMLWAVTLVWTPARRSQCASVTK
jgi:predicted MFS family arabinose efflux permease